MVIADNLTYEKIYFSLWEAAQRYGQFTQFRVIGKSHDERMIPMLEVGTGQECIFCIAGIKGTDRKMSGYLLRAMEEYCKAYESSWELEEFYDVKKLLEKTRICFIPVVNPDGFEVGYKGYKAIRNPIYRQMLRMQDIPPEEFTCNARSIDISKNFPTNYYKRKWIHQEPGSENETKALIRIFQEYKSRGLLSFCQEEKRILYYKQPQSFVYNQKSYRLARHLQNRTNYRLEKYHYEQRGKKYNSTGSPEQFYSEVIKQPSLLIQQPTAVLEEAIREQEYRELYILPLEYIFSLDE